MDSGSESQLLVVPERPGPLEPFTRVRRPDDLDEAFDELFGPAPSDASGIGDSVLIVGGVGTVIAAQVAGLPEGVDVLGALAVLLGLILPIRNVVLRRREVRMRQRFDTLLDDGRLLHTGAGPVADLVEAYDTLLRKDTPATPGSRRVRALAHLAVIEVAGLLRARPSCVPEEARYVAERTTALRDLAAVLADPHVGGTALGPVASALSELEGAASGGSVNRIRDLTADLRDGHG